MSRMSGSNEAGEATRVQVRTINTQVVPQAEVAGSLEQKNMDLSKERKKSMRARYIYGIIFLIPNLCAWIVRDYGQMVQPQLHCMYFLLIRYS